MKYRNELQSRVLGLFLIATLGTFPGCGESDPNGATDREDQNQQADEEDANGDGWGPPGVDPEPEAPQTYEFSRPAIVGDYVYIANESLNSVAIVDSQNLSVRTVPTGSRPTEVVGPAGEGPIHDDARVMALNEGNHTVTLIDPSDFSARNLPVLARSNRIKMAPGGRHALVWYDSAQGDANSPAGDLSAVSVVSAAGSFQVAVGFHIRDVRFDATGEQALVVTEDGISVLKLLTITGDGFSPPRAILPGEWAGSSVQSYDLSITSDGRYVVAFRPDQASVVVSDLDTQELFEVELPGAPTGATLRERDDEVELIAVLRSEGLLLRATVPEGLQAAAEGGVIVEEPEPAPDNEESGDEVPGDEVPGDDAPQEEVWPYNTYDGFQLFDLPFVGVGSIEMSTDNETAFLFTTTADERRAILYDLDDEQDPRILAFEKGISGVIADGRGASFLVFHSRESGSQAGLSPGDPEYLARSWGFSLIDVRTATTRLFLTQLRPGEVTLWSPPSGDARLYMTFERENQSFIEAGHYDVVTLNFRSFRMDTFRLASLPDGLGVIPGAEKVYINQVHPQGRMTFVDVADGERQTVTGYQLNAGVQ